MMDFLDYTEKLYSGDLFQAKVMAVLSIALFGAIVIVLKGNDMLFKGMVIPVFVIATLYGVYSGYKIWTHSTRLATVTELYQANPSAVIAEESQKAEKGIAEFKAVINRTWPIIMVLGLILFVFITKDFVRGIGLGLMVFSLFATIGDLALQKRLEVYLLVIQSI